MGTVCFRLLSGILGGRFDFETLQQIVYLFMCPFHLMYFCRTVLFNENYY